MAELWQALNDNSGAVIAGFTIVLAIATIRYVVVSAKLLKQSKNAFLADMVLKVMELIRSGVKTKKEGEIETDVLVGGWMSSYLKMFTEIDKELGMDITKLFRVSLETATKEWGKDAEEAEKQKKKWEKKAKELEKKLKELKKKLKEKEDLEHPKN